MSTSSVASSKATASSDDSMQSILYQEECSPNFWPILIPMFWLAPFFWKYHVKITESELSFGFSSPISTKVVKHGTTVVQEATPLFDQQWMSFGIHYSPTDRNSVFSKPWNREYIARNGGAVKLVLGNGGQTESDTTTTTFYFSTNDPQKVCDLLNQKK